MSHKVPAGPPPEDNYGHSALPRTVSPVISIMLSRQSEHIAN